MPKTDTARDPDCTIICPTESELSVITKNILCVKCGVIFNNEPRYRMHDARVHKKVNLEKTTSSNVRYHCPVKSCIYAVDSDKYFTMMKYIKQHYLKVHAEKKYPCNQCAKSFSTEAARNAHNRVCGMNFTCVCQRMFNSYEALLTHAKRYSHNVDAKYKALLGKNIQQKDCQPASRKNSFIFSNGSKPVYQIQNPTHLAPVYLILSPVTKVTCNASVQTEPIPLEKTETLEKRLSMKQHRRMIRRTQQTQTNLIPKKKRHKKSIQTQTIKFENNLSRENNFADSLLVESPLPLQHDVGLQDFWEDKKINATQTSPERSLFQLDEDTQVNLDKIYQTGDNYNSKISNLDPLLTEDTYRKTRKDTMNNSSSSIETQTDAEYWKLFDDSDELRYFVSSSNNETQTTEVFDDFEPMHAYSNMYTQTCCDDMFSNSLTLADIQTQTCFM